MKPKYTRLAGVVLVAAGLVPAALPSQAVAGQQRTVCKATRMETNSGLDGARLKRGDRVIVVKRGQRRGHYVIARNGQGWIPSSALCKRR